MRVTRPQGGGNWDDGSPPLRLRETQVTDGELREVQQAFLSPDALPVLHDAPLCAPSRIHWDIRASGPAYARVPSSEFFQPNAWHLLALIAALALAALLVPKLLLGIACAVLWMQAGLRWAAVLSGRPRCQAQTSRDGGEVRDPDWPRYTVLVPLHDEAASVARLMEALARLDYPQDRLEIFMVCEADDASTLAAVRRRLRPPFHLVSVPDGGPRTKPKALRVAMRQARGDIVTIYDAEDAPHPGQLKAAARAFAADPGLAAVQAPLDVDNRDPGWITHQFALEYASLFHVWVPFLARIGWPLPLGGTSNHIRRDALERAGGWDAHNVTEDADLSFRLALEPGARIGWISPPTREEAVADLPAWTGQRTRWMKGFAQSWAAHMHAPFAPLGDAQGTPRARRRTGAIRFLTLQLTVGLTVLTGLLHLPSVVVILGAALLGYPPDPAFGLAALVLYCSGLAAVVVGARRAGQRLRLRDLAGVPLYWMLMALPAWRGVAELWSAPHYWNKTRHGVSARGPESGSPEGTPAAPCPSSYATPPLHSSP